MVMVYGVSLLHNGTFVYQMKFTDQVQAEGFASFFTAFSLSIVGQPGWTATYDGPLS